MRRGLIAVLGLACLQGCTSSYEPARSPRIATVIEGGQPTFVKNGDRIGGPVFGNGLVEAVEGVPEAEHHAVIGRNLVLGGFVLDVVGLGSMVGGTVLLVKEDSAQGQPSTAGTALFLGGAVAALAGSVMILCGQPHIYDAINIYNDSLEPRPTTTLPGPRASLSSRSMSGAGH